MKTIKQPEKSAVCMACCVAMVTDKTLHQVMTEGGWDEIDERYEELFVDYKYWGL